MNKVYRGVPGQRGYGLGGTFRRFFNWVVPLIKKHATPHLHEVGKKALETVAHISKDLVAGKNLKVAAKERINTSVDDLKKHFEEKLEGKK